MGRPQLPFLSTPKSTRQRVRFLTTQRKEWLKHEVKRGVRYTVYFWTGLGCFLAGSFALKQEKLERIYPTPHEWSFLTRTRLRSALKDKNRKDSFNPDWLFIMNMVKSVIDRLENPKVDGKDAKEASPNCPPGSRDVTATSEPWRRGYFEAHMLYAEAAARLDGFVVDKTRNIIFPPELVLGPSNPKPSPIPPGSESAPREEDCEVVFASPRDIYPKIIDTPGFTRRQRMDAMLAFASWLEHTGSTGPASLMYAGALDLAMGTPSSGAELTPVALPKSTNRSMSDNVLKALTAYATFQARTGDVAAALPILITILRSRKAMVSASQSSTVDLEVPIAEQSAFRRIKTMISQPPYPPPPSDGNESPVRDEKQLCEEAALHLHIGEIIFAGRGASREEGLTWTRDAVDMAEEQLRKLSGPAPTATISARDRKNAQTTCRECLSAALQNWGAMVAKLAREEALKKDGAPKPVATGWLGLWGGENTPEDLDRWKAEERVIQERTRRVAGILEDLEPPSRGWDSWLTA